MKQYTFPYLEACSGFKQRDKYTIIAGAQFSEAASIKCEGDIVRCQSVNGSERQAWGFSVTLQREKRSSCWGASYSVIQEEESGGEGEVRGESVSGRSLNQGPDSSISKVYQLSEGEQGFKDDFEVYCLKDAMMTRLEWKWVVPEEGVDRCLKS